MPSSLDSLLPTLNDLRKCGYERVLVAREPSIREYQPALERAAQEARSRSETPVDVALQLLAAACQPMLRSSDPHAPFRPLFQFQDRRGLVPSDFSREQATLLSTFADGVQDPELAARLNDLGWVVLRDPEAAKRAVLSYIAASANAYCIKHWPEQLDRLERALRIAMQLQTERQLMDMTLEKLDACVQGQDAQGIPPGAVKVSELLLTFRRGDAQRISLRLEQWAEEARRRGDFHGTCRLLQVASRGYRIANDSARASAAEIAAAEALVETAHAAKAAGQAMVASHWLTQGVTALQRCSGQQERVAVLQRELEELGQATLGEMKHISIQFDASDLATAALKAMQSKDVNEALLRFGLLLQPLKKRKLEGQALELAQSAPFSNLIDKRVYNGDGRLVALIPALLSSHGEDREVALRAACYEQAKMHHVAVVAGVILPARDELWRLHSLRLEDLTDLFRESPLFPKGRQGLWIKGLFAGFEGEFDIALSLLIPQLEHAVRKQLEGRGVLVWRVDPATSLHSERGLGELLELEEAITVFGEDLVFELRGLLSERIGHNIRNELAHGLMAEEAFFSPPAIYLWWLLYHLAVRARTSTVT